MTAPRPASALAPWTLCADGSTRHPLTGALKSEPPPRQRYGSAAPPCDFPGCAWIACSTGPGGNWCADHLEPHQRSAAGETSRKRFRKVNLPQNQEHRNDR